MAIESFSWSVWVCKANFGVILLCPGHVNVLTMLLPVLPVLPAQMPVAQLGATGAIGGTAVALQAR